MAVTQGRIARVAVKRFIRKAHPHVRLGVGVLVCIKIAVGLLADFEHAAPALLDHFAEEMAFVTLVGE